MDPPLRCCSFKVGFKPVATESCLSANLVLLRWCAGLSRRKAGMSKNQRRVDLLAGAVDGTVHGKSKPRPQRPEGEQGRPGLSMGASIALARERDVNAVSRIHPAYPIAQVNYASCSF
jgi:hypothetical protein